MEKQKRTIRGYKITEANYVRAMKMAGKKKEKLASLVEEFVTNYGKGADVMYLTTATTTRQ